jgi:hydroxyacylglutathione hydrolase
MMILERFVVGMMQTNCYLLGDLATRQAAVIDPGGEGRRIALRLRELDLELAMILNTHAHFDHVLDAWLLKQEMGGDVFLHPDDQVILEDRSVGLVAPLASTSKSPRGSVDRWLHEGDRLPIGSLQLEVLKTPGHTPGHVAFYLPSAAVIFVGDTLFAGSIGRTDFPGGSHEELIHSVKSKIFPLDEATVVLPGHGPETTVGEEKRSNPFF